MVFVQSFCYLRIRAENISYFSLYYKDVNTHEIDRNKPTVFILNISVTIWDFIFN